MRFFKDWSLFEKIWLLSFTVINVALSFIWGDSVLGFISTLAGMLCVVLVAKGKISNYYFGFIQVTTYAYLSFTYGLYGEAMLNAFFYLPIQFIGFFMWRKHTVNKNESAQGEDIAVKRLTIKNWIYTIAAIIVFTIGYGFFLQYLNGRSVWLDSVTNVISITAQILMLKRYAEQWLLWIAVNILTITLWVIALLQTGGGDWSILVMWSAFLFNSVYGYINWIKMSKNQVA